ncbi:MAG: hypothetical protein KGL39_14930 [Patescibacteria group bacterium]|nr:hypothetical protein [Patescibacteria group bacterium]
MNAYSQCAAILSALRRGDTITGMDALNRFGTFRLGARIFDLKHGIHDGTRYAIEDAMVKDHATGKRYKKYWMADRVRVPEMPPAFTPKPPVEAKATQTNQLF